MMITSEQQRYLQLMGITTWVTREAISTRSVAEEGFPQNTSTIHIDHLDDPEVWDALRKQVATCTRCNLHSGRTQTVFGVGDTQADWLLIGEAPGKEEDRQGEPFVGRAGKLLNAMLEAIGLKRQQVFIANILKCRPPQNRDPRPQEVMTCEPYLKQQIELIKPRIILALGRIAAQNLLKVDTPIGRMRGQRYVYPGSDIPVVVTYHPAYLLRSPREKRKSWQDLQLAMQIFKQVEMENES